MTSCILYAIALVLTVNSAYCLQCYSSLFTNRTEICYSVEVSGKLVEPQCYFLSIDDKKSNVRVYGCLRHPQLDCTFEAARRGRGLPWPYNASDPAHSSIKCDSCNDYDMCNMNLWCGHKGCHLLYTVSSAQCHQGSKLVGLLLAAFPFLFYFF